MIIHGAHARRWSLFISWENEHSINDSMAEAKKKLQRLKAIRNSHQNVLTNLVQEENELMCAESLNESWTNRCGKQFTWRQTENMKVINKFYPYTNWQPSTKRFRNQRKLWPKLSTAKERLKKRNDNDNKCPMRATKDQQKNKQLATRVREHY